MLFPMSICCDSPIVEGAGPEQQPATDRNLLVFFGFGKAPGEVKGQNDEERNIPGIIPRDRK